MADGGWDRNNESDEGNNNHCSSQDIFEVIFWEEWELAREVVAANPKCIIQVNDHDRLPIHELCRLVAVRSDVNEMYDDISDIDDGGRFIAQSNNLSYEQRIPIYELAKAMIEKSQEMSPLTITFPRMDDDDDTREDEVHESILTVKDMFGKTPLHTLCEQWVDPRMLRVLLSCTREHNGKPNAPTGYDLITAGDARRSSPLHYVASSPTCPMESLRLIMDYCDPNRTGNRDPTLVCDIDGENPLHWSFERVLSYRRTKELLRYGLSSMHMVNHQGKRPFDILVSNNINFDWKDFLARGRSDWHFLENFLKIFDNWSNGQWLPVHMLAKCPIEFPPVVYDLALHFHGSDLSKSDINGMLPLHLACSKAVPYKTESKSQDRSHGGATVVIKLLEHYPEAAFKRVRGQRRLALHFAAASEVPLDVIRALWKAHPNSLLIRDPVTGLWPAVLAATRNSDAVDISYMLLRADPSIVSTAKE